MKDETALRLNVTHEWARRHAEKTDHPSRFLDAFENSMKAVRATDGEVSTLISFHDPLLLAAEIEALAAWRRVKAWRTGNGLVKGYTFAA